MNTLKILGKKLKPRELKVIGEYIKTGIKLDSYRSVYNEDDRKGTNAYAFFKRESVSNYIQEYRNQLEENIMIDKKYVIDNLVKNAQLGQAGFETTTTKGEDVITTERRDLSSSNRALELVGKDLGMFTNEININGIDELVKGITDKADDLARVSNPETPI